MKAPILPLFLIFAVGLTSSCVSLRGGGQTPAFAAPAQVVEAAPDFDSGAWIAGRAAEPHLHAALVATLKPGKKFAEYNADKIFNPASLVKLSTTLYALKKLGADYRFPVRVFADGRIENGALAGDLYLEGNPPVFNEISAGVVADELKRRGIERVSGKIYVSPRFTFNFHEHADESARLLAPNLRLKNKPETAVAERPAGTELFVFKSYSLSEVLLYMNTFSSNFVAHRVGEEIGGADEIRWFLIGELGFAPEKISMQTTSGLEENAMTARGVFEVLGALAAELEKQNLKPADVLPAAGRGTLRHRFAETALREAAIGKTGTFSAADGGIGMASFAGLIYTKNHGAVAYVLISEGAQTAVHKKMQDDFLKELLDGKLEPAPLERQRQLLPSSELTVE